MIRIAICIVALVLAISDAQAQERKHLQPGFSQDWQGLPSRHFDGSKIPEYKPARTRPARETNFRNV